ncbi:MAG TPA: hypothetical protein VFI84_02110 [Candidatus Saccharimonadales bacterium]|nr:hypothetical protein [Candidatus Saccharimonadales bacterium]
MFESKYASHTRPFPDSLVEQAEWMDTRYLAEAVIRQIGYDHSTDVDTLWEATWSSTRLNKDFELAREIDEGSGLYELKVTDITGKVEYIGFGNDCADVSFTDGEEGMEVVYSASEDADICREIEAELSTYLRSAVIDKSKLPLTPIWSTLFENIMVRLALEDEVVTNYFRSRRFFGRKGRAENTIRLRLQKEFALNEQGINRVMQLGGQNYSEANHGEA